MVAFCQSVLLKRDDDDDDDDMFECMGTPLPSMCTCCCWVNERLSITAYKETVTATDCSLKLPAERVAAPAALVGLVYHRHNAA